jgi:hypothetical protein
MAQEYKYDVFLCHNSRDKSVVKVIANQLKERGLRPWLDEWQLRPGLPWQRDLEEQIESIGSAAVFVGSDGIGPWQQEEIDALLQQFLRRQVPIIPVLLPGASTRPELPPFLANRMWIDFGRCDPDPIEQLIWGISGRKSKAQGEISDSLIQEPISIEKIRIGGSQIHRTGVASEQHRSPEHVRITTLGVKSSKASRWFLRKDSTILYSSLGGNHKTWSPYGWGKARWRLALYLTVHNIGRSRCLLYDLHVNVYPKPSIEERPLATVGHYERVEMSVDNSILGSHGPFEISPEEACNIELILWTSLYDTIRPVDIVFGIESELQQFTVSKTMKHRIPSDAIFVFQHLPEWKRKRCNFRYFTLDMLRANISKANDDRNVQEFYQSLLEIFNTHYSR